MHNHKFTCYHVHHHSKKNKLTCMILGKNLTILIYIKLSMELFLCCLFLSNTISLLAPNKVSERYMDAAPTGDDNEKQYGISIHN